MRIMLLFLAIALVLPRHGAAQSPELQAYVLCEVDQSIASDLAGACAGEARPHLCLTPEVLFIASDAVVDQLRGVIQERRRAYSVALGVPTAEIAAMDQAEACALVDSQISNGGPLGALLDGLASD